MSMAGSIVHLRNAMRPSAAALCSVLAGCSLLTGPTRQPAPGTESPIPTEIEWADDPTTAFRRAQATKRPMLFYFAADWCSECWDFSLTGLAAPSVVAAAQAFIAVRVDVDDYPRVVGHYRVSEIPDIRFLAPDGSESGRMRSRASDLLARQMRDIARGAAEQSGGD